MMYSYYVASITLYLHIHVITSNSLDVVNDQDTTTLTCKSAKPWFFCSWTHISTLDRVCAVQSK